MFQYFFRPPWNGFFEASRYEKDNVEGKREWQVRAKALAEGGLLPLA